MSMTIDLRVGSDGLPQRLELVAKAVEGNAEAQYELAELCRTGDGWAERDLVEALNWYTLAARQGHAGAQNNLGAMYHNGVGVPVNTAEAAHWYRLAANQGFAMAQFNLALLLGWGIGVPQDEPEAARLLHKATAQGHIEACSALGTFYRFGNGVEKHLPLAAGFHVIAALEGDAAALGSLSDYLAEIEAEALGGSLLAALCLAKMYDRGLGVERDKARMFSWLLWGEERGIRDDDADVFSQHDDMRGFYGLTLPDAIKDVAWALFNEMRAASPRVDGTKPQRRRKPSPRQTKSAALKRLAGGG
jgi:TPR repeat protein